MTSVMQNPDLSLPSTMNAWVIDDFGGPEIFERRTIEVPEPSPQEVLVRATSVNPVDYKIRRGDAEALPPAARHAPRRRGRGCGPGL